MLPAWQLGISCTCATGSCKLEKARGGRGLAVWHVACHIWHLQCSRGPLSLALSLSFKYPAHNNESFHISCANIFIYKQESVCVCGYMCVGTSHATCCGACNSYLYSFMRFVITNAARRQCEGPSNEPDPECGPWIEQHARNAISLGHKMST